MLALKFCSHACSFLWAICKDCF